MLITPFAVRDHSWRLGARTGGLASREIACDAEMACMQPLLPEGSPTVGD